MVAKQGRLAGKTAIITGAANGIGLAIARHFTECGALVMHADMDEASLVKEFGGEDEDAVQHYFAGDLRESLTLANLLSATLDAFDLSTKPGPEGIFAPGNIPAFVL